MNEQQAPVTVGEIYEVGINAVGGKGDGIAKVKGFVLFVPNTKKGDYVKVKVTKVLANVGFAEVVGQAEKPVREQRYQTVSQDEFHRSEKEPETAYEDTENFGE